MVTFPAYRGEERNPKKYFVLYSLISYSKLLVSNTDISTEFEPGGTDSTSSAAAHHARKLHSRL